MTDISSSPTRVSNQRYDAMELNNFEQLYVHELQDLYSAESQLIHALPKVIDATRNDELRKAFEEHLEETKEHKRRLETIFQAMGSKPGGVKCEAMEGLIKEASHMLEKKDIDEKVRDAALIAGSQRIEHYEISGYGTARRYAESLGRDDDRKLLNDTLNEESHADELLNEIAINTVNPKAKRD
jgi:ferritin-like metal-binding protein YciE